MRIGIHTSTSGALVNAALQAVELGANCFQIFSGSPRMWRATTLDPKQVAAFKQVREQQNLTPLVIHDSYLINLAAADTEIRAKSIAAFRGELQRAYDTGAEYLVMHPGSHKDQTLEQGIEILAQSLAEAAKGLTPTPQFQLLLENTAGGGSSIGRTVEDLKAIRDLAQPKLPFPVGYCLDTCHLLASGYDVASAAGLEEIVLGAEKVLGLERVPVIHTNDSKGGLGSRLDRHANIGEGQIGLEGFKRILNHPKLNTKAFILETPVDSPGDDKRNVDTLKSLCPKSRTRTKKSS